VRGPDELEGALDAATSERADALSIVASPFMETHRQLVVDLVAARRLPAVYNRRSYVEVGGLMAYGPNYDALFRRAALYVDKILKGAQPAELPIEQPMLFDFVISLKTAQALGLTIPQHVLLQATGFLQ
jgi:putative ABC transport system substrate-binding protein